MIDISNWPEVVAHAAAISVRLPSNATLLAREEPDTVVQTWRTDNFLVTVRSVDERLDPPIQDRDYEKDYYQCKDIVHEKHVRITHQYSEKTTIPGRFIRGYWSMPDNRKLTVAVHSANSSDAMRDTLFSILQTVQFLK